MILRTGHLYIDRRYGRIYEYSHKSYSGRYWFGYEMWAWCLTNTKPLSQPIIDRLEYVGKV